MGLTCLGSQSEWNKEWGKNFFRGYFGDTVAEKRFQSAATLSHPHICVVHDVGEHQDQPYIVMERLAGETLKHRLEKGPLEQSEALKLGTQIATALEAVDHRQLVWTIPRCVPRSGYHFARLGEHRVSLAVQPDTDPHRLLAKTSTRKLANASTQSGWTGLPW